MKALEDYSNKWKALVKIFSSNIVDPFYLQGIGSKTPMYASNHSTELGIYRCFFFFFFFPINTQGLNLGCLIAGRFFTVCTTRKASYKHTYEKV